MKIENLLGHVKADILDTIQDPALTNTLGHHLNLSVRRFKSEGFPYLNQVTDTYKRMLASLCNDGTLSTSGLDLPDLPIQTTLKLLGWYSWPMKLTFAGESQGIADYDGFVARSRECENFAGVTWEDILPMNADWRRSIRRLVPDMGIGRPKHGPGATADYYRGWDKWLPVINGEVTYPSIRMTDVPKDRRKRRLIGMETAIAQFLQQGFASALRATPWFRRWVNLEDQEAHVKFAAEREATCTVDLSDASDRIPCSLVEYLLPEWYPWLAVTSSAYASLPDGRGIRLGMMATMGNGFCFELETLIFHIVASLAGRIYDDELGGITFPLEYYAAQVRVYGDDVIIPQRWFPSWEKLCQLLGWQISYHKTGLTSRFLETCGTYITPSARVKRLAPTLQTEDRWGQSRALAWDSDQQRLDSAMSFHRAGFPRAAKAIARPVVARARFRWSPHGLQRAEVKLSTCITETRVLNVQEETRLLAYYVSGLSEQVDEPIDSERITYQWVPIRDYVDVIC